MEEYPVYDDDQFLRRGNQTEDIMKSSWWKEWFSPYLKGRRQDLLESLLNCIDITGLNRVMGEIKNIDCMRDIFDEWIEKRDAILLQKRREADSGE